MTRQDEAPNQSVNVLREDKSPYDFVDCVFEVSSEGSSENIQGFPAARERPLVTIIMPLFNTEEYVVEAVESIRQQTYQDWELIILDDLSRDEGLDLVTEMAKRDRRIKVFRNKTNLGAAVARNLATRMAKGRYIAFIDSDDVWEHEKLRMQVEFMQRRNAPFSYTSFTKIDCSGRMKRIINSPSAVNLKLMHKGNFLCTSSVMYDTELLGRRYFPDIRRRQDYGLWLNILNEIGWAPGLPQHLTRYRMRPASLSGNVLERFAWNWRLHRHVMGSNIFVSAYRLAWNVVIKVFVKP